MKIMKIEMNVRVNMFWPKKFFLSEVRKNLLLLFEVLSFVKDLKKAMRIVKSEMKHTFVETKH